MSEEFDDERDLDAIDEVLRCLREAMDHKWNGGRRNNNEYLSFCDPEGDDIGGIGDDALRAAEQALINLRDQL